MRWDETSEKYVSTNKQTNNMKYVFTFESSALLSEYECKLLQQEFHDMIIKHFEDGMFHEGVIRNMRKEK